MKHPSRHSGFTLIELLVVVSIILIASSIIFIGTGGGEGAKLSSAQRMVSGIAQGARGQAILKNQKTRLIIYSESPSNPDEEKYLRYFGIVYQDPEDEDEWIAATRGDYLPEGIYFDPELSAGKGWPSSATMNLEYPRRSPQPDGSGPEYYYYEFNSNGTMASSPQDFMNSWLVIRAGSLRPGSDGDLEVDFALEGHAGLKAALIFRRVGTTTMVNDPEDVD
ncbi:MAG: prepilin-type N-terminal cleavage/methylation domain-containing protein [Verrucomicrobiota bacterium]